jgi:phage shock protein C
MRKVFRRDSSNGMIGGVCEGIANYVQVTPGIVRVATMLGLIFTFGFTALLYVLLWMFIPDTDY